MKKNILYLMLVLLVTTTACKKGPGEGGKTSIIGKVWEEKYVFSTIHDSLNDHWAMEQDIYIIYGDEQSYGNRIRTGPDGLFEFQYLRKGSYTIYVYSDSTTSLKTAVKKQIDIPKSGTSDIGTFTIKKITN